MPAPSNSKEKAVREKKSFHCLFFFVNTKVSKSLALFERDLGMRMQCSAAAASAGLGRDDVVHPRCRAFGQWSVLDIYKKGRPSRNLEEAKR